MIDGIKCSCNGLDYRLWKESPLLDLKAVVSTRTGEIASSEKDKLKHLTFILSPNNKGSFSCSFHGSLHKYKKNINYDDFTHSELTETIADLEKCFYINPSKAIIHGLEIGVNIELEYNPNIIFKSALCHKGKLFDGIDRINRNNGLKCHYTDYTIKIYNKGKLSNQKSKHILRYEIKLHRQRGLNLFNISKLSDLSSAEKVAPLICLLLQRLNEIIFYDFKNPLKVKGKNEERYSNPKFWEELSLRPKQYYRTKTQYKKLIQENNCIDWASFLSKKIFKKWIELLESKQKIEGCFPQVIKAFVSNNKGKFSNLEYLLDNVANSDIQKRKNKKIKASTKNKRYYCITCGRELIDQKASSRFCSEKTRGKDARKCRNIDSNKRSVLKRKIIKAMKENIDLIITYKVDDNTYSDILNTSEICLTKEWLNRIESVEVLGSKTEKYSNKEAHEYLLKNTDSVMLSE